MKRFQSRKSIYAALFSIIFVIGMGPFLIHVFPIEWVDQQIYKAIQISPHTPFIKMMRLITHLGDTEVFIFLGALFSIIAFFYFGPRFCLFSFFGFLAIRFFVWIVKESIERVRPVSSFVFASGFSFPSGHATNIAFLSILTYWFLEKRVTTSLKKRGLFLFLLFIVFMVGISRILLQVHWTSDVIAGYILGFSIAVLVKEWGAKYAS